MYFEAKCSTSVWPVYRLVTRTSMLGGAAICTGWTCSEVALPDWIVPVKTAWITIVSHAASPSIDSNPPESDTSAAINSRLANDSKRSDRSAAIRREGRVLVAAMDMVETSMRMGFERVPRWELQRVPRREHWTQRKLRGLVTRFVGSFSQWPPATRCFGRSSHGSARIQT